MTSSTERETNGSLARKKIVLIGGTSGLGLSAARAFIDQGARVVAVGRDSGDMVATEKNLGESAVVLAGDACQVETSVNAIEACMQKWGGFDGLYHVAGGSGRSLGDGPLHQLSLEGWNKTIELNLTSLMLSNQAAIKQFIKQGSGGSILNMGSVLGFSPSPHHFSTHAYAAAKSAIVGFSKSVAAFYAKDNIRINVIAPGLVKTPMAERAAGNEEILSFIRTKQPMDGGRIGQPEDLDGLAVYFMSDLSKFTTGQVVAVDGGWSISDGQW